MHANIRNRGCTCALLTTAFCLSAVPASADVLELTVNKPKKDGLMGFALTAPDGSEFALSMLVSKNWTAGQKADALRLCFNARQAPAGCTRAVDDNAQNWRARNPDNATTFVFVHRENNRNKQVWHVSGAFDSSGEHDKAAAKRAAYGEFTFGLEPGAVAFGYVDDLLAEPSTIRVETTGAAASVDPTAGTSVDAIVADLFGQLQGQGADVVMVSPYAFDITDTGDNPFMTYESTDRNIAIYDVEAMTVVPEPSTLALLFVAAYSVTKPRRWRR